MDAEIESSSPLDRPADAADGQRGRPRDFDVDIVLDAALDVFWKNGYRQTTTRHLERATGLSQSSIYNAFGSKWGVLDAALGHYENTTNERLLAPLEGSEEGLASIARFFTDLTDWISDADRRGCMLINLMAEDGAATPAICDRVEAYRIRTRSALAAALVRAHESGEVAEDTSEVRADLLVALVMGLDIAARGGASERELGALLRAIHVQIEGWQA